MNSPNESCFVLILPNKLHLCDSYISVVKIDTSVLFESRKASVSFEDKHMVTFNET